ncbi:type IV pilin protein [uncultured Thiodictyon sp.]|uniref:type IV pilin protein n=1 Tax=uncultured Thiodictyon sp. TaxID=1846217 RepID=UPI0025CDEE6D|nr:type IV pilin protein [uncultured Thiodictyon sp.]
MNEEKTADHIRLRAALAYPSYLDQVRRGQLASGKAALLENAQFLERNYTVNNCYHRTDANCLTEDPQLVLPVVQSPPTGVATYTITVAYSAISPCTMGQCFIVSAEPIAPWYVAGDPCGTLTINQAGIRGANDPTCWRR